jgi:hypothetical protein
MSALFHSYVMVDWSAAATPKTGPDSIWIGWVSDGGESQTANLATRDRAVSFIVDVSTGLPRPTLIGFDFPLGYPAGTAAALGLIASEAGPTTGPRDDGAPPWKPTWQTLSALIDDDHLNRNNRFEVASALNERCGAGAGPFWGVPPARATANLSATKLPGFPYRCAAGVTLEEFRRTERHLRARGGRVQSGWQLFGVGSVGSQALTGIPAVEKLRAEMAGPVCVWPLETGLRVPDVSDIGVVVAEIWPGLFVVERSRHPVKDAAQVLAVVDTLRRLDAVGALSPWFRPAVDADAVGEIVGEEAWILGVD